jgi:hypothetical protein
MKYAVVMKSGKDWHALIKSDHYDRCYAVFKLCDLHLAKLYPKAKAKLSPYREQNLMVDMHPDRELILSRLLASEFPLPRSHDVLEGEYTLT